MENVKKIISVLVAIILFAEMALMPYLAIELSNFKAYRFWLPSRAIEFNVQSNNFYSVQKALNESMHLEP